MKMGNAGSGGCAILCNHVLDRWDCKHVVEGFDGGGAEGAADAIDCNILGNL